MVTLLGPAAAVAPDRTRLVRVTGSVAGHRDCLDDPTQPGLSVLARRSENGPLDYSTMRAWKSLGGRRTPEWSPDAGRT